MRLAPVVVCIALFSALAACSKGGDPGAQATGSSGAPAAESQDSTSLSIDTSKGAVSYETQDGANSTSISVGGDEGNDGKDKK